MNNKILIEQLTRIHQMMGLPNGVILTEQDIGYDHYQAGVERSKGKKVVANDESDLVYPEYTLGPLALNLDYVGFNTTPTKIMGPKDGSPPKVWRFTKGTKIEDLISGKDKSLVKRGDIVSKDGTTFKNQPYMDLAGQKFCLPTQIWVDTFVESLGGTEGPVYKFENPKTGLQYAVVLEQYTESRSIHNKELRGQEISLGCYGGDNGWHFITKNIKTSNNKAAATPYKQVGGTEYYNLTDIAIFDPRSDDNIFWDTYGVWIELGIGALVALLVPPLGAAIWTGLGLGATNVLAYTVFIVSAEIILEGSLLAGKIQDAWSRGNKTDATLTALFCLMPLVMEWKPFAKVLSNGINPIKPDALEPLLTKIEGVGGFEKIYSPNYLKEADVFKKAFYDDLPVGEKQALNEFNKLLKNASKMAEKDATKEINDIMVGMIRQNPRKAVKVMEAAEAAGDKGFNLTRYKIARAFTENLNLYRGQFFGAKLGRGMVLIGPVAISLKWLSDTLYGPSDVEKWTEEMKERYCKFIEGAKDENTQSPPECAQYIIEKALDPSSSTLANGEKKTDKMLELDIQLKAMATLYKKLGWTMEFDKSLNDKLSENLTKDVIGTAPPELVQERVYVAKEELIKEAKNKLENSVNALANSGPTVKELALLLEVGSTVDLIEKIFAEMIGVKKLLPANENEMSFTEPWEFYADGKPGRLEFIETQASEDITNLYEGNEDYTFKIYIEDVEVYPNKETQKPKEDTTTTTTTITNGEVIQKL